ncbi:MAG: GNAT family N-acetyltransferase [Fimbriimonas sp.]|nr:GNAT family N-acetyltransferase [Fimbriimonas sp.]
MNAGLFYLGDMTTTLETERLVLRPISMDDAPDIQRLFNDWEVVKWLADVVPWPYPDNGAEEFLSRVLVDVEKGTRYSWAIMLRADPEHCLIGVIELFPNAEDDHRGFWLGSAYHNQGLMREAVAVVNDFAFEVLNLDALLLNNAEPNVASHRLKERSGAEILRIQEDEPFVSGRYPCVRWRLTREAWRANRQRFVTIHR